MFSFVLYNLSFVHSAFCVTCGLTQSEWRKIGGFGGKGHEVNRPFPTENIAKTAVKGVSPRRLHLTALAVSKTRLNIRLREIANLCRIKRIKRIKRPHWRALRMVLPGDRRAAPMNINKTLKFNSIFNFLSLYFIFIYIINSLCTGSVERICIAALVYNLGLPQSLLLDPGITVVSYAFI